MFTALALTGALLINGMPVAASVGSQPVRYAGLTSCAGSDGKRHICGPWRLWLRGGRTIPLPDAQLRSLDTAGREQRLRAPIAVDAYGRYATYFSKSSHKLVVRNVASGKVTRVAGPAASRPADLTMTQLELLVSPGGRYVVIDPNIGTRDTTVVEVASGKQWKLPDYAKVRGFSPDGRLLRVLLDMEETAVYKPGGRSPSGGVTLTGWGAMANGGGTLAGAAREGKRVYLRFYATSNAMESRKPLRLSIPAGQEPRRLDWVSPHHVSLLTYREPRTYVARSVSTVTGASRITDTFTIARTTWDVHMAGE